MTILFCNSGVKIWLKKRLSRLLRTTIKKMRWWSGHSPARIFYRTTISAAPALLRAHLAEGKIDAVMFFCDPLTALPHDPDVRALLRIAVVYDVPIATNKSTADCILAGIEKGVF